MIATPPPAGRSAPLPDRTFRFAPRRQGEGRGRAHSRLVGLMRIMLPLMALVIIGLILVWPQLRDTGYAPTAVGISASGGDTTILSPRFDGMDSADQPYSVTADRAVRPTANSDQLNLAAPEAEITLSSGRNVRIEASDAIYNETTENLVMRGDVRLRRDDGYTFRTEEAHANVGDQSVWSDQPVTGSGPAGTIDAEGFRIEDSGDTIIFTGRSRLVLFQRRGEPDE